MERLRRSPGSLVESIGRTPLVKLRHFNLFAKCEHMNPGGSVKDRLALALVDDGEAKGCLKPGDTIVEATAGNTGMGLALVAAARGYSLVCVLPEKMSVDKRKALEMMGARVVVTANAPLSSPENFRNVAKKLARENSWFLADQFCNQANVEAHFQTTGPEILEALGGEIGAFVAGVGTGGTISGVGRYLKEKVPSCQIVLADPLGSSLADWINGGEYGPDGPYAVEGIGSSKATDIMDRSVVDLAITVSDEESFAMALRLQREEGMLVGGSSGTAVVAALKLLEQKETKGPIVVLMADSWDRYFSQPWMANA